MEWSSRKVEWSGGEVEWSSRLGYYMIIAKVKFRMFRCRFSGADLFQFGHHFYKNEGLYERFVIA